MRSLWALLGGAATALAFPPLGIVPTIVSFAFLLAWLRRAESGWQAFRLGWCFGFGFYLTGLYWVAIAFFVEADKFGPIAVPAILLLTGTLGVIIGIVAVLSFRIRLKTPEAHAILFAALWTLSEIIRGNPGLQFPWNPLALVWSDWAAMMQLQAWIGTPGLSFLTVALAALPVGAIERRSNGRWLGPLVSIAMLTFLWVMGNSRLDGVTLAAPPETTLRLVQPSIPQHERNLPGLPQQHFEQQLGLSQSPGGRTADVVIWAETAVPYSMQRYPQVPEAIAQATPGNAPTIVGANYFVDGPDNTLAHNSLWVVLPDGTLGRRYDKVDLVPFGEFLPLRSVLTSIGLQGVAAGNLDFRAGPGRATFELEGIPPFSPLICYEAVFPGAATDGSGRAAWLLNITNDAWFGHSFGPYQHLAMARARAIEEGLPLVRTANNGVSVITDAYGRVLERLSLDEVGTLEATLPPRTIERPFYVVNQWIVAVLLLFAATFAFLLNFAMKARLQTPNDAPDEEDVN